VRIFNDYGKQPERKPASAYNNTESPRLPEVCVYSASTFFPTETSPYMMVMIIIFLFLSVVDE